jgi:hypothetical protein
MRFPLRVYAKVSPMAFLPFCTVHSTKMTCMAKTEDEQGEPKRKRNPIDAMFVSGPENCSRGKRKKANNRSITRTI